MCYINTCRCGTLGCVGDCNYTSPQITYTYSDCLWNKELIEINEKVLYMVLDYFKAKPEPTKEEFENKFKEFKRLLLS